MPAPAMTASSKLDVVSSSLSTVCSAADGAWGAICAAPTLNDEDEETWLSTQRLALDT
jgi:hypothetical protein